MKEINDKEKNNSMFILDLSYALVNKLKDAKTYSERCKIIDLYTQAIRLQTSQEHYCGQIMIKEDFIELISAKSKDLFPDGCVVFLDYEGNYIWTEQTLEDVKDIKDFSFLKESKHPFVEWDGELWYD